MKEKFYIFVIAPDVETLRIFSIRFFSASLLCAKNVGSKEGEKGGRSLILN